MSESASAMGATKTRPSLSRLAVFSLVFAACLIALYAHIRIAQAGDDYTGILAPLDRVFDIAFALLLVGISFCVGRGISGKLGLEFASLAEEISFSVMLGVGTTSSLVMGLGLIGALKPVPVAGLLLLLIAISHREAARLRSVLGEGFRAVTQTRTRRIVSVMFILLAGILVLRAAAPPHNYDEAIYHLSVSKSFVERERIYPVYDNWAGNMPFLLHMFYAVCLMVKSDIAAKMFSLCLAGISSLALYAFCVRFLDRRTGTIAMFGLFGAGMVVEVAVTARIDVSMAGILFLATYAMMNHLETGNLPWLWTSAALAGFGLSIKYTAGFWFALLLLMFLFETLFRRRHSVRDIIKHLIAYLFIAAIIASPWYIKNLVWFHNPVYPFITGEVAEVVDGRVRYFSAADEQRLEAHFQTARTEIPAGMAALDRELAAAASRREQRHPFRVWEYFIYPDKYGMGEPYHDPNSLFVITPLVLILWKRRWTVWLAILSFGFYVAIVRTSWVARILIPVYPAMTVLAAYLISETAKRAKARVRIAALLPAVAILITLGPVMWATVSQMRPWGGLSFITGSRSRREYMYGAFYYPAIDFINHNLPTNVRVMMIGAEMCYDMRRQYVADVNWDTTEWRRVLARNASMDDVNADLKNRGITHILFAPSLFAFAAQIGPEGLPEVSAPVTASGPDYRPQLRTLATFELFRSKFLEQVYSDNLGYHLYQIN